LVGGGADLHTVARLGAWERLLELAQARGIELGMVFLEGTTIRAHQKAAGVPRTPRTRQRSRASRLSRCAAGKSAAARRPAGRPVATTRPFATGPQRLTLSSRNRTFHAARPIRARSAAWEETAWRDLDTSQ
jgi:hypothetical protein